MTFANAIGSWQDIKVANGYQLTFRTEWKTGGTCEVAIVETHNNGYRDSGEITGLDDNTILYARWKRDDDASTYGTCYLDVYSSSANRSSESAPLGSVSITCNDRVDFRYFYAFQGINGANTYSYYGFQENIEFLQIGPPSSATGAVVSGQQNIILL